MSAPTLPNELYDDIIFDLRNDIDALKSCSLASSILTPWSQRHIFSKIVIGEPKKCCDEIARLGYGPWSRACRLRDLISPHLAAYVRTLVIYDGHSILCDSMATTGVTRSSWLHEDSHVPFLMPLFKNLSTLELSYGGDDRMVCDWNDLPVNFLECIKQAFSLPFLRHIRLETAPLFSLFQVVGPSVKKITIGHFKRRTMDFSLSLNNFPESKPSQLIHLESLVVEQHASLPAILDGFRQPDCNILLCKLKVLTIAPFCLGHSTNETHTALQGILEQCPSLEKLSWLMDRDIYLMSTIPIDLNVLYALKQLNILDVEIYHETTILRVMDILRKTSVALCLEQIFIQVRHYSPKGGNYLQRMENFLADWTPLVEIVNSDRYPKLNQVKIQICGKRLEDGVASWSNSDIFISQRVPVAFECSKP